MVLSKRLITLGVGLLALDQVTKAVARAVQPQNAFFELTYNSGASFGIFPGYNGFFLTLSVIVLVLLARPILRAEGREQLALALFWLGVFGNGIDRVLFGHVTDFINILSVVHFPIFNIADALISLSAAYLAGQAVLEFYHGWQFKRGGEKPATHSNARAKTKKK